MVRGELAGGLLAVPQALDGEAGGEGGVRGREGPGGPPAQVRGGRLAVDVAQDGGGADDGQPAGAVDEVPQHGGVAALGPHRAAQGGEHERRVVVRAPAGEHPGRRRAERVAAVDPGAGPLEGGRAPHALEGGDGGLRDQGDGVRRRGLDEVEGLRVVVLGEVAQSGGAGGLGAEGGGLDDLPAVLGPGDGGQAAGGGDVPVLGGVLVEALLGPVQDLAHAPAGPGPGRAQLALPAVEGALLPRRAHAGGEGGGALVVGPQPPGPGLEGVAHRRGERGLALGGVREPGEDRGAEGREAGVVVAQGQLVEGPGPVGADGGVAAQEPEGVGAAVGGEVAEDGQGQTGALLGGVERVVRVEEVPGDLVEAAVEVQIKARVVKGAVLHLPVAAGVAEHALVQRRERLGARRREGVQGPVAAASLQEAEQGATGRYVWIEHGVSIRCGESTGNGISVVRHSCRCPPRVCRVNCGNSGSPERRSLPGAEHSAERCRKCRTDAPGICHTHHRIGYCQSAYRPSLTVQQS